MLDLEELQEGKYEEKGKKERREIRGSRPS
jgi:hypothetical protein